MPLASEVMNASAALLNDAALTDFTYAVQIPYLNIALDDLQEILQANNVPITNLTNTSTVVNAGITSIGGGGGDPALPTGLVDIQRLWERLNGTTDDYVPMTRKEFLPALQQQTESLIFWAWIDQVIRFIGATTARQVRIDFIQNVVTPVVASTDNIDVIGSKTFLSYRTAALCAQYIGENEDRYEKLNAQAQSAIDALLTISTKGRQSIVTRRRPFMAAYRSRGFF